MRLPSDRNLLIIAAVVIVAWVVLHARSTATAALPWNRGQAGSIFQGGHGGGGQ